MSRSATPVYLLYSINSIIWNISQIYTSPHHTTFSSVGTCRLKYSVNFCTSFDHEINAFTWKLKIKPKLVTHLFTTTTIKFWAINSIERWFLYIMSKLRKLWTSYIFVLSVFPCQYRKYRRKMELIRYES